MGRLAFVFPGQGSQQKGMGADLLQDGETAELASRCSAAAGIDLAALLTQADEDQLRLTQNAQPALCFMGIALAGLLARRGVTPDALAGHSVGEYSALAVAGAIAPEEAVLAVRQRGLAMADAVPAGESSMAAVLGLDADGVVAALAGIEEVWPANFNTPTQTVIAGAVPALELATPRLLEAGARRVLPLNVSAAFHTPLMAPAAARLRSALDGLAWQDPGAPVVANVDAAPYEAAIEMPEKLERQLRSPVLWSDSVSRLSALGCDTFVELGPKRALTGMMRELAPAATAVAAATPAALSELQLG